jgi:hypothetical protein
MLAQAGECGDAVRLEGFGSHLARRIKGIIFWVAGGIGDYETHIRSHISH